MVCIWKRNGFSGGGGGGLELVKLRYQENVFQGLELWISQVVCWGKYQSIVNFDFGIRILLMIRVRRKKMGKLYDCIVEWIQGDFLEQFNNSSEFYFS